MAVDQSTGDVYVALYTLQAGGEEHKILRFDSSGAPKNFTAGPNAGTNTLTGFQEGSGTRGPHAVAIDNSGGPLDGTIYVADGRESFYGSASNTSVVKAFARTGAPLGSITEAGAAPTNGELEENPNAPSNHLYNPCGLAVDQTDGSLYVAEERSTEAFHIWRYAPSSPSGAVSRSDYDLTGIIPSSWSCALAANAGHIYSTAGVGFDPIERYEDSDFNGQFPKVEGAALGINAAGVAVDPGNGDVYADEGFRVSVLDNTGKLLYRFAPAAEIGARSPTIAVKSSPPGAAAKVYVAFGEESTNGSVEAYGPVTQVAGHILSEQAAFGDDGTAGSTFFLSSPALAFSQATRALYVLPGSPAGIYGFDAASPPSFSLLPGFSPLATAATGNFPSIAVDNSSSSSEGNIYFVSSDELIYGFDSGGTPLGGAFPIDPATNPGAPTGSPKGICGAAVDPAGDIWVANSATKRILEYSSAGAPMPVTIDVSSFTKRPCGLAFDSEDNLYIGEPEGGNNSVWRLDAADGYSTPAQISSVVSTAIAVDRTNDHLFVTHRRNLLFSGKVVGWIDEYDENGDFVDEYVAEPDSAPTSLVVDETNHFLYVADNRLKKIRVFNPPAILPEPTATAVSPLNTGATLKGTVATQGVALTECRFEYVSEEAFRQTGFSDLSSGGTATCVEAPGSIPLDFDPHPVSAAVSGLTKYADYRFRLVVSNAQGSAVSTDERFTTSSPPGVEIVGAPERTATTAVMNGRVNPRNALTSFHFEYGDQGPCDANPCAATPDVSAGSDNEIRLVAAEVEGLAPNTTYHYRLVAENGNPEGVSTSADMTVTTRASDAALSHGHFPGPPGSDRAYEQVSVAESGGNPVGSAGGFSDDGNRALYVVNGGTPITDNGTFSNFLFAERTAAGWRSSKITPERSQAVGSAWGFTASTDFSTVLASNSSFTLGVANFALWRLSGSAAPAKLFQTSSPQQGDGTPMGISADGSRIVMYFGGFYDLGSDPPNLLSLLPGGVPACVGTDYLPNASAHWISADGSRLFFPARGTNCTDPTDLYMRDIEAGQTTLLSGPVISGPDCNASLIRSTADSVFFWTRSRLVAQDNVPAKCATTPTRGESGDVYRYDLDDQSLECVTCVVSYREADPFVATTGSHPVPWLDIAVAPDGSRVYFRTTNHLLPGAPPDGQWAAYRIDVASGELAFVAPLSGLDRVGQTSGGGNGISDDGSVLVFRSNSVKIDPIGVGGGNGEDFQYYRYDDRDRSLVCISCTSDGSSAANVPEALTQSSDSEFSLTGASADGSTVAFITSNPLLGADQNTPGPGANPAFGQDVYEWRDGRLFLITDGLTSWPANGPAFEGPNLSGVSRSGRDVYFTAPVQYTPDALDGYRRLYDARIGGGIEFPPPPKPCPLEVCQGIPKGSPEERTPGTGVFVGPGNEAGATPPARCRKNQRAVSRKGKTRCVAKPKKKHAKKDKAKKAEHRANDNRRAAR